MLQPNCYLADKMKSRAVTIIAAIVVTLAPAAHASDALSFFNNWFVTGDYAVAGVGLRGTGINGIATGTINLAGLPPGAEPIAAFLYWSTIEFNANPQASDGKFNGNKIRGYVVGNPQNPGCYSSGGTTGSAGAVGRVYRADVLRYLPFNSSNIRLANGAHTVALPDSGANGNGNIVYTNGASLVVIYRIVVPGSPTAVPLRSVVIYNGAFTMDKNSSGMTQNVAGFYQALASSANVQATAAKITDIVANGQAGFSSPTTVNDVGIGTTNPFIGSAGTRWDNPTFYFGLPADASSFPTHVTSGTNQTCLTFAAIIASTVVKDTDSDGLLDTWETNGLHRNTQVSPATFGGCADYPHEPCVNLPAMGADPLKRDIFLQVDWMNGTGGSGGTDGFGTHDHIPKLPALDAVANTFAPRGIMMHFDVGKQYQGAQPICGNAPCGYIIPSGFAQGGNDINESTLICHDSTSHTCDYHEIYPVISFEFGFASVRDGNQKANIAQHFASNRKDVFHYTLFAHALAGPFDINGKPVDPTTGQPTTVPKSYSGIAQRPGGGIMVTLGLWRSDFGDNDQVGSALVQAGTLMHELGHNLDLSHGGLSTKPNCMPNYQSVMNYLYQTRGLTDVAGLSHLDYSDGLTAGLTENLLSETPSLALKYRARYYGPYNPAIDPPGAPAKLTCDGKSQVGLPQMVRLENAFSTFIDWDHNGVPTPGILSQDVNFDGVGPQTFTDQPDWASLNLQQIGSGPNFGGLSVGALASTGGFATDAGGFATDAGGLATDAGVFTSDAGGFATDAGGFATDGGGFATDAGGFATDAGGFATDAGDINFETMVLSTIEPPPPPGSCPTCGLVATPKIDRISLTWTAPETGNISSYNVYRSDAGHPIPSLIASVPGGVGQLSFDDVVNGSSTLYNTAYTYSVTSVVLVNSLLNESQPSTTASGIIIHLYIAAQNASRQYGDPNPISLSYTASGINTSNISSVVCTSTATPTSLPGAYPINCSATISSPIDGVTYTPGTLTITARIVTASITSSDKVYDGTTAATIVSCTVNGLVAGDVVTCTGTGAFPTRNAGTFPVTATAITLSGAASIFYSVPTLPTTTSTYKIIPAPAAVTPNPASKVYGTADPVLTGTLSGFFAVDAVTAAFNRSPGEDAGIYVISATLSPASVLGNYAITYNTSVFTIYPAPQTISFPPIADKIFGNPPFSLVATASSGLPVVFAVSTGAWNCSISASTATLTGPGTCSVTATQPGNNNYLPATSVTRAFHIAGFVATGSMSTPRSYHTATLLNSGKVLVAGGFDNRGAPLASAELYDPLSKTFSSTGQNMPNKAAGHTATLLNNGQVLLIGGSNSSSELYDPIANTFTSAGGFAGQRSYHTATLLGNGKVLIAGGSDNSGKTTNSAILYDPSRGSYSNTGNMTVARDFQTATLLTSGPNAGKVLIVGGRSGSSGSYTYLASAELYDPSTGAFTAVTGAMTTPRYGHTTSVFNGTVIVAGGAAASTLSSAESFDPISGAFTAIGPMSTARQNFTATIFGNAIVVAGGRSGSTRLSSAEMLSSTTFQPAGTMTSPRSGHTATVLSSGAVLYAGGEGTTGSSLATAEVLQ
jgi:hypothetical protein